MAIKAMYNPRLFSVRQEFHMPAKKAASKKRKQAPASRKKAVAKQARPKKAAGKKRPTRRKQTVATKKKRTTKQSTRKSTRKSTSKKTAKKVSKKPAARKKAAKKKIAGKKAPARKAKTQKTSTQKTRTKKAAVSKTAAPRKSAKKPAAKKPAAKKPAAKKPARPPGDVLNAPIHGIAPYKPQRGEEYMSDAQLEHFREILNAWKRELMYEVDRTVHHMQDEAANFPDPNDRATQESEFGLELRTRDRERKLLRKIDSALSRIDDGSYGFCEETGEEIGLKRLEARPVATLCLEAQERRELAERQFRDRDDRYR